MAFSTLINYFWKLFEGLLLGVTFRHVLAEITRGKCSLKETDPNVDKKGRRVVN